MTTSYQPGDRVLTNVNGVEVEVSVVKLSIDVEVKTADGKVWWRALSRVRPVPSAPTPAEVTAPTTDVAQPIARNDSRTAPESANSDSSTALEDTKPAVDLKAEQKSRKSRRRQR